MKEFFKKLLNVVICIILGIVILFWLLGGLSPHPEYDGQPASEYQADHIK